MNWIELAWFVNWSPASILVLLSTLPKLVSLIPSNKGDSTLVATFKIAEAVILPLKLWSTLGPRATLGLATLDLANLDLSNLD